ncbi:MAG TPA: FAD-binding oxidoreductase [Gaiellaceae bacterium]|nr:FAD-binding oxidoreductase [Gaiellaceae bacterium]
MSTTNTALSIDEVRAAFAGEVIAPGDASYDGARAGFLPSVDRRPAVIIRPADVQEVARVVSLARESGLELAVRSGGHSATGHSSTEGGILLDLSSLNGVEIDPERRLARVEAGATAEELTEASAAHGLAIGLGDTGSVGIGGLTLGGGVGYLVRKHGLTIDSLLGADVVTAGGELVRADDETNPDLFWALRGGGGNFGVVTRFTFRLQPLDLVTGGMLVLPATADAIASFIAEAEAAPEELSTIANVMPAPPMPQIPAERHGELVILAMMVHAGAPEDGERVLARFRALAPPVTDLLRPMSYPEIYPPGEERGPLAVARNLFLDEVDAGVATTILEHLGRSSALMPVAQLRVLGGAMARVPPEATAFAHRGSRIMVNLAAIYSTPDEAPLHEAWVNDFAAAIRQEDTGAYVNFLGSEGEAAVRAAYPGRTFDRLAEVKRRWDPANVFRLNHNISPA